MKNWAGILLIPFILSAQALATQPSFQGLGDSSLPYEISGDGSMIVGRLANGNAGYWQTESGWVDLGFGGYAYDVDFSGTVIIGWTGGSSSNIAANNAFRWTSEGGVEILAGPSNQAYEVSDNGQVVVGAHGVSNSDRMAFYYTPTVGTVDLSALLGLGATHASAVSGDGDVIAGTGSGPGFIWQVGDPTAQTVQMAVYALSYDGTVAAGFRGTSNGSAITRWTAENGVVELPQVLDLPTSNSNYGYDITSDGSVITGYHSSDTQRAVIWDENNGMRFLKDDLEQRYNLDLAAWQLRWAYISADGLTLTGLGVNPSGGTEGWIATIPEPATLGIVSLGGLIVLIGLKRRKSMSKLTTIVLVLITCVAVCNTASAMPILGWNWVRGNAVLTDGTGDPLPGTYSTWDLLFTTGTNFAALQMIAEADTAGDIYQHPGGGITEPNPFVVDLYPDAAFDTYVTAPDNDGVWPSPASVLSPVEIAGEMGINSPGLIFDDQMLALTCTLSAGPELAGPGTWVVARLTIKDGGYVTGYMMGWETGHEDNRTELIYFELPEPATLFLVMAAGLGLLLRRRQRRD